MSPAAKIFYDFMWLHNDLLCKIDEYTYDIVAGHDLDTLIKVYEDVLEEDNIWYVSISAIEENIAKALVQKIESMAESIEPGTIIYPFQDEEILRASKVLKQALQTRQNKLLESLEFGIDSGCRKLQFKGGYSFSCFVYVLLQLDDREVYKKLDDEGGVEKLEYIGKPNEFDIWITPNESDKIKIGIINKQAIQEGPDKFDFIGIDKVVIMLKKSTC